MKPIYAARNGKHAGAKSCTATGIYAKVAWNGRRLRYITRRTATYAVSFVSNSLAYARSAIADCMGYE